ncbi:MAG TPA: CBM35 domain-containing protein, partial [Kribbellaceae bacterium]|nr:CBM35 domain-containing protein [Kribbellaceae bacterium]
NTWAGPQAPRFLNQLQIDEVKVAFTYPFAFGTLMPLEAESLRNDRNREVREDLCLACSGSLQVTGLGRGEGHALTYSDVTVAQAGTYRLEVNTTAAANTSLSVSVNGAPAVDVAIPADRPDVPSPTALAVPLNAGANTVKLFSKAIRGPGIDRIAVGPLPPASYVPKTTMTVDPSGLQWVGPGQQSMRVSAKLRLDVDDAVDQVQLAPVVPAGWTVEGAPATATTMRLGQTLEAAWTITSPPGQDISSVSIPIRASFQLLGRPIQVNRQLQIRLRPADRVFMREAEDSRNLLGSAGITSCGACSGGQKVRNLGGSPDAFVVFDNVVVDTAGEYTLFIDYTVNGTRSFFVSVNGGPPVVATVTGVGNNTSETTTVPVTMKAGVNTIKVYNDEASCPDLDRLSLGAVG